MLNTLSATCMNFCIESPRWGCSKNTTPSVARSCCNVHTKSSWQSYEENSKCREQNAVTNFYGETNLEEETIGSNDHTELSRFSLQQSLHVSVGVILKR